MVHVKDKKFACESCIKGHRTSLCNHTDRQLFEIKRKGRPVSQCEKCRELRKTRRVHSKCLCSEVKGEDPARQGPVSSSGSGSKLRRFVPIAPALPSTQAVSVVPKDDRISDPRHQVDRLLNPCKCKSIWECECRPPSDFSDKSRLETLVEVASSVSSNPVSLPPQFAALPSPAIKKSCCASKTTSGAVNNAEYNGPVRGPALPPLLLDPERMFSPSYDSPQFTTPTSIPSIKSVVLLAGTGCCCGFECACPGCIEHRVAPSTTITPGPSNLKPCSDGCAHCVDHLGGVALPETDLAPQQPPFRGAIETFLSRAASLPTPPRNRPADLDPTNVTVFPPTLFSVDFGDTDDPFGGYGGLQEKARSAWGLVDVPKLECCGGACGCPDGGCGCGASCAGCCVGGDAPSDPPGTSGVAEPMICCTDT